jgi:hypothetical protein
LRWPEPAAAAPAAPARRNSGGIPEAKKTDRRDAVVALVDACAGSTGADACLHEDARKEARATPPVRWPAGELWADTVRDKAANITVPRQV